MNNFSKVLVGSSIVLGAMIFSVGCGGDSFCCGNGEPPIPKIADDGTNSTYSQGQYTLENDMVLKLNGLSDSVDTDNGTISKCNWYIADKDGKNKKLTVEDKCENVEIDFSSYANNTTHLVCLEVIDNDNLSSKLNNGRVPEFNSGGEIRKKDGAIELRKEYDCRKVVIAKGETTTADYNFGIYNTNNDQKVSATNQVKQGCPYYIKPTLNVTSDTTCVWSIDNVTKGTDCDGITGLSHSDLNDHEICLTVNGDSSTKKCQTFTAIKHNAPTAIMNILDNNNNSVTNNSSLSKNATYKLSCSGSKNDCPEDESGVECKWNASSFKKSNGSCNVPEASRDYKFKDCLAAHDKNDTSAPNTSIDLLPEMYTCNSNDYDCIEVNLTVTDTRYGQRISSQTISKIYEAQ